MVSTHLLLHLPIRLTATSAAQRTSPSGQAEAWDFSINSTLCPSIWSRAGWDFGTVLQCLESRKAFFHDTASRCASMGLFFRPLVLEAIGGGWSGGLGFSSSLSHESHHSALLPSIEASLAFAQRISSTLHRENARAILKRSSSGMTPERSSLCLQVRSEDLTWLSLSLSR